MLLPALLAVPIEIRALDAGDAVDRVWRLAEAIGEAGVELAHDVPYDEGRPVRLELSLPGAEAPMVMIGVVEDPRHVAFKSLEMPVKQLLQQYIRERKALP